ncbi:unnamed protein product [Amoebophrya sp. A120]|nr:unnamed protein product [Amoebophrya sp. A120]|eukprot:GSA120T00001436001.1
MAAFSFQGGAGNFWSSFYDVGENSLSDKIAKPETTLEDVLDDEQLLQLFRDEGETSLQDWLCEETHVRELLTLLIKEPPPDATHDQAHKFPFVACELFSCEVPQLLQTVVQNHRLLDYLFSFLMRNVEGPAGVGTSTTAAGGAPGVLPGVADLWSPRENGQLNDLMNGHRGTTTEEEEQDKICLSSPTHTYTEDLLMNQGPRPGEPEKKSTSSSGAPTRTSEDGAEVEDAKSKADEEASTVPEEDEHGDDKKVTKTISSEEVERAATKVLSGADATASAKQIVTSAAANEPKGGSSRELAEVDHLHIIESEELNSVLAGYFCKVVSLLLLHFPMEIGAYLRAKYASLLSAFFKSLYCRSVMELYCRMINTPRVEFPAAKFLRDVLSLYDETQSKLRTSAGDGDTKTSDTNKTKDAEDATTSVAGGASAVVSTSPSARNGDGGETSTTGSPPVVFSPSSRSSRGGAGTSTSTTAQSAASSAAATSSSSSSSIIVAGGAGKNENRTSSPTARRGQQHHDGHQSQSAEHQNQDWIQVLRTCSDAEVTRLPGEIPYILEDLLSQRDLPIPLLAELVKFKPSRLLSSANEDEVSAGVSLCSSIFQTCLDVVRDDSQDFDTEEDFESTFDAGAAGMAPPPPPREDDSASRFSPEMRPFQEHGDHDLGDESDISGPPPMDALELSSGGESRKVELDADGIPVPLPVEENLQSFLVTGSQPATVEVVPRPRTNGILKEKTGGEQGADRSEATSSSAAAESALLETTSPPPEGEATSSASAPASAASSADTSSGAATLSASTRTSSAEANPAAPAGAEVSKSCTSSDLSSTSTPPSTDVEAAGWKMLAKIEAEMDASLEQPLQHAISVVPRPERSPKQRIDALFTDFLAHFEECFAPVAFRMKALIRLAENEKINDGGAARQAGAPNDAPRLLQMKEDSKNASPPCVVVEQQEHSLPEADPRGPPPAVVEVDFNSLKKAAPSCASSTTTTANPLYNVFELICLFTSFVTASAPATASRLPLLLQHGIPQKAIELFFLRPWNSILHNNVVLLMRGILHAETLSLREKFFFLLDTEFLQKAAEGIGPPPTFVPPPPPPRDHRGVPRPPLGIPRSPSLPRGGGGGGSSAGGTTTTTSPTGAGAAGDGAETQQEDKNKKADENKKINGDHTTRSEDEAPSTASTSTTGGREDLHASTSTVVEAAPSGGSSESDAVAATATTGTAGTSTTSRRERSPPPASTFVPPPPPPVTTSTGDVVFYFQMPRKGYYPHLMEMLDDVLQLVKQFDFPNLNGGGNNSTTGRGGRERDERRESQDAVSPRGGAAPASDDESQDPVPAPRVASYGMESSPPSEDPTPTAAALARNIQDWADTAGQEITTEAKIKRGVDEEDIRTCRLHLEWWKNLTGGCGHHSPPRSVSTAPDSPDDPMLVSGHNLDFALTGTMNKHDVDHAGGGGGHSTSHAANVPPLRSLEQSSLSFRAIEGLVMPSAGHSDVDIDGIGEVEQPKPISPPNSISPPRESGTSTLVSSPKGVRTASHERASSY